MIRFIYFTDPHGRANSPGSRLDNFPETIIKKIEYVGKLGKLHQVDGFIVGGDILDRPDTANSFMKIIAATLTAYKKPIYAVLGNHDIYGQNPETFDRTALGVLEGAGIIRRLSMEPLMIVKGDDTVTLTGKDSYYDLDKPENISDYTKTEYSIGIPSIHIVHGFISESKWPKVNNTTIEEIALEMPNADIILSGHEHTGYEIVCLDVNEIKKAREGYPLKIKKKYKAQGSTRCQKIFCNPGALARVTASVGDVNQDVKVALIEVERENFSVELIQLPIEIARPASEVLDREKLIQEKQHQEQLAVFTENLKDITVNSEEKFNIYTTLDEISKNDNIEGEIINLARERLTKAEEQLKKE